MKTIRQVPIELVEVEGFIPETEAMSFGKLYYSKRYKTSSHICVCGCGKIYSLPIKEGEWIINVKSGRLSVSPSIHHRINCKSHYVITDGKANLLNYGLPEYMWGVNYGFDDFQSGE